MSLILSETPLNRFGLGGGERPGIAVTYGTSKGDIVRAGTVTLGLTCRVRYEIDMSDHRDEVVWSLPSTDERQFHTRVGVGWRVHDPCVVTQRRVYDGFEVIKGYLHPVVRRLSREREIEELHQLEDEINQLVSATAPARFAEGLEVYHLDAQLSSDENTLNHAATVRTLSRELIVAEKRHVADISAARSQIDIDALRRQAIEKLGAGEYGLLLLHLTKHPDDTMGVLKLLQQQDQTNTQARNKLLEQLRDQLLPEELGGLAELLVQETKDSIERPPTPQLGRPHVPPAIVAGTAVPAPAPPSPPPTGPLTSTPPPDNGVKW